MPVTTSSALSVICPAAVVVPKAGAKIGQAALASGAAVVRSGLQFTTSLVPRKEVPPSVRAPPPCLVNAVGATGGPWVGLKPLLRMCMALRPTLIML